ncbi:hypothetical protein EHQ96_02110 [Leptospira levettii]|uniref:DUF3592 domain-containing protein n=1 Tax=Leptospira levettii TaxID=2023178 RepID=A0ABY2MSZ6_9LEPT|nr:hypothetical protein CH354_14105 [Leptospira levettii]PKA28159.1 hypothetical protein CH381_02210 [Leptospira sp. mixed culture ATI2-C-A1]PJZ89327.1 hypothetical protein CH368_07035 [Leptospira levettii]PJZ98981.1 hypothetical protein CH369_17090 [Leptospira levettii]TGL11087.1 hypothetical protein EHQ39_07425 [Leptospira levettii]
MTPRISVWISNSVFVSFFVISIFYSLIYYENSFLKEESTSLINEKNRSFARVQELSRIKNQFPIAYQCHYNFGLSDGSLYESTERIPYSIYKRLRLGDSIEIYKKELRILGKPTAISRIMGNEEPLPLLENLEKYFKFSFYYFLALTAVFLTIRVSELLLRTYPSRKKPNETDVIVVSNSQDLHQK